MPADPDTLVPLTTARSEFEAENLAEAIRAQGIRVEVFATAANTLQWDVAFTDPIKVMVRRADVEQAAKIVKSVKAESVDIDWSEVDTGDPTPDLPTIEVAKPGGWSPTMRRVKLLGWLLLVALLLYGVVQGNVNFVVIGVVLLVGWAMWRPKAQPPVP